MKQTRTTGRKRAILEFLGSRDEAFFQKYGPPPYNAKVIAENLAGQDDGFGFFDANDQTVQSFARTLRTMTAQGLLVTERAKKPLLHAVYGNNLDTSLKCYYSAATVEKDKIAAQARNAGEPARKAKLLAGWDGVAQALAANR